MQKTLGLVLTLLIVLVLLLFQTFSRLNPQKHPNPNLITTPENYWFLLKRKSNIEFLYLGEPGSEEKSKLVRVFRVKTGIPGERPTPLPKLLGKQYWLITAKYETLGNPETAPYFLTLNIPVTDNPPFGPEPYLECNGQCNWQLPGSFGLHGDNGDRRKLASDNPGSSGCIRHSSEDITYLYNLLDLSNSQVRYYIDDV